MVNTNLPAFSLPGFPQLIDSLMAPEMRHIERSLDDAQLSCPPTHDDYLMLDLFGTVLEVRRMRPSEARDINLELEALDLPYHWAPLAEMTD